MGSAIQTGGRELETATDGGLVPATTGLCGESPETKKPHKTLGTYPKTPIRL